MIKSFLMLVCLSAVTGLATGCGADTGPKDMPKETTPEPGDTTMRDLGLSSEYC